MFVRQILNAKPNKGVITTTPDASLKTVSDVLVKHNFGCIVISETGANADGILSERDIVRAIARRGAPALDLAAKDVMTQRVFVCSLEDEISAILSTMSERRFRHMPVLDQGTLVGLITQGDVVKAQLTQISMENEALENMIRGH